MVRVNTGDVIKPGGSIDDAIDGNIFNIIGYVRAQLRNAGNPREIIKRYTKEATTCHSYDDACEVSRQYLGEDE